MVGERLPAAPLDQIRLVLLDLDGTALGSDETLSAQLLETLRALRGRVLYTFVSARSPAMLRVYCAQAKIAGPVITYDGGLIVDWASQRKLDFHPIPATCGLRLMELCNRMGLDYTIYTADHAYLGKNTSRLGRFRGYNTQAVTYGVAPAPFLFYEAYQPEGIAQEGVVKLFIENPNEDARGRLAQELEHLPEVHANCTEGTAISITARESSKEAGIHFLYDYLGLKPEQVCAFGDYYNDLGMFRAVGASVAMGNAPEEVRQTASYVTRPNTQNGVAWFLQRFIGKTRSRDVYPANILH